jgi:hypothetical protein
MADTNKKRVNTTILRPAKTALKVICSASFLITHRSANSLTQRRARNRLARWTFIVWVFCFQSRTATHQNQLIKTIGRPCPHNSPVIAKGRANIVYAA